MRSREKIDLAPVDILEQRLRLSVGSKENSFNHKLDTIHVDERGPNRGKVATHELDHFLLHAFTPFGAFLDELAVIQRSITEHYCEAIYDMRDVIRHPAYTFAERFNDNTEPKGIPREVYGRLFGSFVRPWSKAVFLEEVLEGHDCASVVDATIEEGTDALHLCEELSSSAFPDAFLFANGKSDIPKNSNPITPITPDENGGCACPSGGRAGARHPIGASNLFESHAFYTEMRQDGVNQRALQQAAYRDPALRYVGLAALTLAAYGHKRVRSKADGETVTQTLLALCDLALFTPIGAIYGRLRPKKCTWGDIHPGYRFLLALDAVKVSEKWLEKGTHEKYREFQDRICYYFDWVKPADFIRLGSQLKRKEFMRHQRACLVRERFANPFSDEMHCGPQQTALLSENGPLLYASWHGRHPQILAGDQTKPLPKLLEYFLRSFCWRVMTYDAFRLQDCLPKNLDYTMCFSNILTAGDFLKLLSEVDPLAYIFKAKLEPLAVRSKAR